MKLAFLPTYLLFWVLVLSGLWIVQPDDSSASVLEYVFVGVLIAFGIINFYIVYVRIKRKKQGLPEYDELSRKMIQKAAAKSFYISMLLWLVLTYIQSHSIINIKLIFSLGMIGMAIIFVINWMIINHRGIKDE